MRRNIELDYGSSAQKQGQKIYLYTHWGALGLEDSLRTALIRGRARWNDPPYLARIIFSEMVREDIDGLTGYGLAPYVQDPEYPTIAVSLERQTVDGLAFDQFVQKDYRIVLPAAELKPTRSFSLYDQRTQSRQHRIRH